MKTVSKSVSALEVKNKYKEYINDSFDLEVLELDETSTPKERAVKFLAMIRGRHNKFHFDNIGNTTDHLQGLGEGIDLDYMNFDIIERAKKYGLIDNMMCNSKNSKMKDKGKALENVRYQITKDYFRIMSNHIHQLAK